VTAVTSANGGTIDISGGLDIDANAGTFRRNRGSRFSSVLSWLPQVNVTYVALVGRSVPAAFNSAARIILQNSGTIPARPTARPSLGGRDDDPACSRTRSPTGPRC
jgi:hypothetical protein